MRLWPFSRKTKVPVREDLGMQWSGVGGSYGYGDTHRHGYFGLLGGFQPGTDWNWAQEVKDPAMCATVFACLRWVMDNIGEPELQVQERTKDGRWVRVMDHPALELLEQPNDFYDGESLLAAIASSYLIAGDGYVLKNRVNNGLVSDLWWKPWWSVTPRWPADGAGFIADYLYRPAGRGSGFPYERRDVLHFRWGLDQNTEGRGGTHRTWPILREIAALNEGSTYLAVVLKNLGIIPYMITPKDATLPIKEDTVETIRKWFLNAFSRDSRGKPLIPSIPLEVQEVGVSPEKLTLERTMQRPSMLVCGAFGIHPAVIFLSTDSKGLDNGGQHAEARKQSYQDCLIPMCKRIAKTLTKEWLSEPQFTKFESDRRLRIAFNFDCVDALAEDMAAKEKRYASGIRHGTVKVSEYRAAMGLPVEEGDEVYLRPGNVVPVDEADEEVELPTSGAPVPREARTEDAED